MDYKLAEQLVRSMVENERLILHMKLVSFVMKYYADQIKSGAIKTEIANEQDISNIVPEDWALAGLLHDADWEKYPELHPAYIVKKLESMGLPVSVINAIHSHADADWFIRENIPTEVNFDFEGDAVNMSRTADRKTLIDKFLFACDELTGMVYAVSLMKPDKLDSLTPESVLKKFKDKNFAKGVNRDDVLKGVSEIGIDISAHIRNIIDAVKPYSDEIYNY